jgi:hypothetical protein
VIAKLTRLSKEAHFGVPVRLHELAKLRVLNRSDLMRLLLNDKGVELVEPHKILDTEPGQFVGILSHEKVAALKERIIVDPNFQTVV